MINIKLDEKSEFIYDAQKLTIKLWDRRDGRKYVGEIKFASLDQLEILELMLEQMRNKYKEWVKG